MAKWDDCIDGQRLHPESLMMGYGYRPEWSEGAAKSPIFQTSTFVFESAEAGKAYFELALGKRDPEPGEKAGLIYSRLNNPDLEIAEDRLTLWEQADDAALFKSGMAAISTTMWTFLRPGDVVLAGEPIYGGTDHILSGLLPEFGIDVVRFGASDTEDDVEAKLAETSGNLAMVLVETPANPTNDLFDVAMCARVARRRRTEDRPVPVAVDNTFLGPLFQRPLDHGADIVLYSATKYLGGHSDLIAGAALGAAPLLREIKAMRTFLGTMTSPFTGWLLMRSLETLDLRMRRQQDNAQRVAAFLAEHPKVAAVRYLGLLDAGDPQYELYKRQCLGPGGMISFEVHGGEPEAFRFLDALRLVKLAVSLGGTESLVEHPATMTHAEAPADEKAAIGVTPALVRLSVGVEHPDDLVLDLGQALDAV
ncbi:MAG: cystathionine gamma-synthase family protein [Acidimicrobiia bacterium]|nr:cystathionine gamma-synthase family protein [Acidimicrobiia bacterium]